MPVEPAGADVGGGAPTAGPLRVGLAGCGGIARQYHLRLLQADPGVELVAIADPLERSRAALPPLPGVELMSDTDELIARDDVDAIVVCASTPAHAGIAAAVAGGGKHLYLEKPVAIDLGEGRALEAALAARTQVTAVGFNYRLNPTFRQLRERLLRGLIGEARHVRVWHCEAGDAERMSEWKLKRASGGGVLLDIASHEVDMARWLLGTGVEGVVEARISSIRSEHDDARLLLRMENGVQVEIVVSYVQGRKHRWEVEGSRGILRAERWPARLSRPRRPAPRGPSRLATSLRAVPIPRREPSFGLALNEFVGAALGGVHSLPTIEDGRRSLEVVLAAERAATYGMKVTES